MTPKLEYIHTKCIYLELDDYSLLFSYNSPIFKIVNDEIVQVYPAFSASTTTTKHINMFIDQYGYLKLGDDNLYEMKNPQRKKAIINFYQNQDWEANSRV